MQLCSNISVINSFIFHRFGADANERNGDGCSPLQLACAMVPNIHQADIVEALLSYGADPTYHLNVYSYRFERNSV